jgi:hypothetical protein
MGSGIDRVGGLIRGDVALRGTAGHGRGAGCECYPDVLGGHVVSAVRDCFPAHSSIEHSAVSACRICSSLTRIGTVVNFGDLWPQAGAPCLAHAVHRGCAHSTLARPGPGSVLCHNCGYGATLREAEASLGGAGAGGRCGPTGRSSSWGWGSCTPLDVDTSMGHWIPMNIVGGFGVGFIKRLPSG